MFFSLKLTISLLNMFSSELTLALQIMPLNNVINVGQGTFNLIIQGFSIAQEVIFSFITPLFC